MAVTLRVNTTLRYLELDLPKSEMDRVYAVMLAEINNGTYIHTLRTGPKVIGPGRVVDREVTNKVMLIDEDRADAFLAAIGVQNGPD